MVVRWAGRDDAERVDRLFHPLADPMRRHIVRVVLSTEQSLWALAERYPMSIAAVPKHVAALECAELVREAPPRPRTWSAAALKRSGSSAGCLTSTRPSGAAA
jgi:hypothetical protein